MVPRTLSGNLAACLFTHLKGCLMTKPQTWTFATSANNPDCPQHIREHVFSGTWTVCPPATNPEFAAYLRSSARRSQLNRSSSSRAHAARSPFFKRGEGCI